MIAYLTYNFEPTIKLAIWALERNGFEVKVVDFNGSLAEKLKYIYNDANDDFLRVDADVVVNKNITSHYCEALAGLDKRVVWWQFRCFDWFKLDTMYGGVQLIKKEALPSLRANIDNSLNAERPETEMFRLKDFFNPRACLSFNKIAGIHGYGIRDYQYVKDTKDRRGQNKHFDWEMVERLYEL